MLLWNGGDNCGGIEMSKNSNKDYEQESSAIKIRSIQAASLYRVNNGYKFVQKRRDKDGSFIKEYKDLERSIS